MKKVINISYVVLLLAVFTLVGCTKEFLELEPRGTALESGFYQTEGEIFEALVAAYDMLTEGLGGGWGMPVGLLNSASDDTFAGGSDSGDQPAWVALDAFTLDPVEGPQADVWNRCYAGVYRANLVIDKAENLEVLTDEFRNRTVGEAKFLRAYYYFELVRWFKNVPLIIGTLGADEIYEITQAAPSEVYAQIEADLTAARNTFEIPETVGASELGRITKGAATALLGKVILYQNNEGRMVEAANLFEEVINSGLYALEPNFADIFDPANEFGIESVFEINYSGAARAGWGNAWQTEGNLNVQFFGMRDYVGPDYASGWSFCPVTPKLVSAMENDPRYEHTIIDGNALKAQGASYTEGYQNTDYFVKKYAAYADYSPTDGEVGLNWGTNVREIRLADVILMAAECHSRSGNDGAALSHLNTVRSRVGLQPSAASGSNLLDAIYKERQLELATEGHRFWDLVRTGRAAAELADQGFIEGKNEILPIPQAEVDITQGNIAQNPGY